MAIELNEGFATRLRSSIRDSRLTVVQGSAEFIDGFLGEHGLPAPDAVISGIPFSTMPRAVADRIAAAVAGALARAVASSPTRCGRTWPTTPRRTSAGRAGSGS